MKFLVEKQWIIAGFVFFLILALTAPVLALESDGPEGKTAVFFQDDSDDEESQDDKDHDHDDHSHDEDDHGHSHDEGDSHGHGDPNQILSEALIPLWVGLLGGFIFAGGINVSQREKINLWGYLGLALIGITAVVHLVGGIVWSSTLLVLNGLGYLGLGAAWVFPLPFIPQQKKLVSIALIVYTLVTIVGYFATHSQFDALGIATKAVEFALLIVLGISIVQDRKG